MKDELLTISQMCERFGVTPRALRFYETKELLFPLRVGTRRRYTYSDQVRVKLILRGKKFGFQLEEIRVLLNLYDPHDPENKQLRETYRMAQLHLLEMIEKRDELTTAISELQKDMRIIDAQIDRDTQKRAVG